jgi:hypothetical protein
LHLLLRVFESESIHSASPRLEPIWVKRKACQSERLLTLSKLDFRLTLAHPTVFFPLSHWIKQAWPPTLKITYGLVMVVHSSSSPHCLAQAKPHLLPKPVEDNGFVRLGSENK